jgi:hypothetical protein
VIGSLAGVAEIAGEAFGRSTPAPTPARGSVPRT